ncbi:MAG TPA: pilus assembly protein TadG-related protein [Bryobacteraceae bacterium]|nr:pilus assembly protein TadG-related protein [Bryobacteraceae bacterium]
MTGGVRHVPPSTREKGFALIATALGLVAIIGIAGISVDLGRMYVAKSELMAYTDAASVAAALQLDGTAAGITRAQNAAAGMATGSNAMGYDFATKQITGATTQFAKGLAATPNVPDPATWDANPATPGDYRFVQVTASATVPLTFMKAFQILQSGTNLSTSTVNASSVAAQALVTTFPAGLLPFSPIAPSNVPDNFGLTPGVQYTLRYPSGGGLKKGDVCAGDQDATYWQSLPSQDRGFWGSTSAAVLRGEVIDDNQVATINIGDPVPMVGGNKNTEGTALDARVNEDSDPTSATYADYMALGQGNGRRIIGVPINGGPPNFDAVGIGEFFLLPTPTYLSVTGTKPICAEYVGPYVQGSTHAGAGATAAAGNTGGYVVRLIQ